MSQIDDNFDEAQRRYAERLAQRKREDQKAVDKRVTDSAFAKKVQTAQVRQTADVSAQVSHEENVSHEEVLEALVHEAGLEEDSTAKSSYAQRAIRALKERVAQEGRDVGEGQARVRAERGQVSQVDRSAGQGASQHSPSDSGQSPLKQPPRKGLESSPTKAPELKPKPSESQESSAQEDTGLKALGDEPKVDDAPSHGDQNHSGGDHKGGGDSGMGTFHLNPALLAPVPVAQPKDTLAPRMRALANEIAQKIVERVRVGTNAAGMAEFQIELKSSVLSGLNIKISATNGRIRAHFSGKDKEVLRLLQEQSQGLKTALEGRGLRLDELKIEALV